jgi:hypothetical protein
MDASAMVRPCILLPPHSEVAVMRQRSFWDGLMFGFSASLTLWQDLPAIEAALVIAALFGAAVVIGSAE